MKFESFNDSVLFSQVNVPDIFFTEYLPQLDGKAIKIYLFILFLSKYNKDIKFNDLSKKLNLENKEIQDAIKSLESLGLFIRKNQGYQIVNIQELELNKAYKPRVTIDPSNVKDIAQNKKRASAIDTISTEFFNGVMPTSYYTDIDLWFKQYDFDEEVMIALFRYCYNKSALHKNYIRTVANAWKNNSIKTFADLDEYYKREEKLSTISSFVRKKLRLNRNLSEFEEEYVSKWYLEYKYDTDIIEIALKKTVTKTNPSLNYVDSLLTDWYKKDLKTPKQIQNYLDCSNVNKANTKTTTTKQTKNGQNFKKSDYDDIDFDKLYKN